MGKVQFLFLANLLLVLAELFFGGGGREGYRGGWAQRSNSMKFLEFPDIS